MSRSAVLPLGIDIGTTRVRIAAVQRSHTGEMRLVAAGARDLPSDAVAGHAIAEPELVAAAIDDLRRELGVAQRRCIIALPASGAMVRLIRLPAMGWNERRRCARIEAERFAPWDCTQIASTVRVRIADRANGVHAVGIAREDALAARAGCVRRAGLRAVVVDLEACALRRGFGFADAVLDVGLERSTLHAFTPAGPISRSVDAGGASVTRAIASDLSIAETLAEKRKRILGTAGAGERARDALGERVAEIVAQLRGRHAIRRIAVTGNGARLAGLNECIETRAGLLVDNAVSDLLRGGAYPDDVVRAAAPDWTLASCLAAWSERA